MKKSCAFLLIVSTLILAGLVQAAATIEIAATQGKACDWRTPDTTMGNISQLMTRSGTGTDCKKSWVQFDLTDVYAANPSIQGNIVNATLTFYGAKSETGGKSYVVSGLNDAPALENWVESALTWNTGPGNNIAHGTALDTTLTTSLYSTTIPVPVLDVISETPEANRQALTNYLNTDTDGKITLIFTAGQTTYLWNAGQPLEPVLTLWYDLGSNPLKAHDPIPADGVAVLASTASLSWTNPEPNNVGDPIYCDVYFGQVVAGQEPNRLSMSDVTLGNNVETVAISSLGSLVNNRAYWWIVDCHDPVKGLIQGEAWQFTVGQAPVVNAGPDQVVWLGTMTELTVNLDGTVTDDGVCTYLWEQVPTTAPAIAPNPTNAVDTSVVINARGVYEYRLTATDNGGLQSSDTVRIVVGDDACDASHLDSGQAFIAADANQDCIVDVADFVALIADDWLACSDTLNQCRD